MEDRLQSRSVNLSYFVEKFLKLYIIHNSSITRCFIFDILEFIARNKGQVFSKEQIYDRIWGEYYVADNRNITAYINKIRKKIEPDQSNPIYIQTVWGVGYKFNEKIG